MARAGRYFPKETLVPDQDVPLLQLYDQLVPNRPKNRVNTAMNVTVSNHLRTQYWLE